MRQLDAELRRFFARRIVRGMFLMSILIVAISVLIPTVHGKKPSAREAAAYRQYAAQEQQFEKQMSQGGVSSGDYPSQPSFIGEPHDTRVNVHNELPSALDGSGLALMFVVFVLGASFVGAEFNVGSLTTQLMFESRRWRVHAAKAAAVVIGSAVFVAALLVCIAAALYAGSLAHGVVRDVDGAWWMTRLAQMARITGVTAFAAMMAYAVTLVFRRTSAGVIAFFLQYPLMTALDPNRGPFRFVSHYNPLRGLVVLLLDPSQFTESNALAIHTRAGALVLCAVWTVVLFVGAGLIFSRSEVR